MSGWRNKLVRDLTGAVLEVGVGTGENLPHYRQATQVWGIEPDASRAAAAADVTTHVPVIVKVAAAEEIPFADAMFDHVVSSLVFCSVAEPAAALAEIGRVLKPDGTLHMVEHIRPRVRWLAWLFEQVTPWWRRMAHNCHLDRPTIETLQQEGWTVRVLSRRGPFVRLEARLH